MKDASDQYLLREFAVEGSEAAFAGLVQRYINLVYSTALRQLGEAQSAQDVTQAVFIILARKAPKLGANVILPAWLYCTTKFAAADVKKAERRRMARELEATVMAELTSGTDPFWERLAPQLDDAMEKLSEKDRAAIVLRFFERKSFQGVGDALGTTDDSAQKRVTRALEKLRRLLLKRGVVISTTMLGATLLAQCVQAAPANIALGVTMAAVKGAVTGAPILAIVKGTMKTMLWNKLKVASACSAPVLFAVGIVPLAINLALDNFKPIQVQLALLSTGGDQVLSRKQSGPVFDDRDRIVLGAEKPAALRRVPNGVEAPLYGELSFGPSEDRKTYTFLLDEPDNKPSRIWVDRDGDGDLTDDPSVEWTLQRSPNPEGPDFTVYHGEATLVIHSGGKALEFGLKIARLAKDHPNFQRSASFLMYERDYARTGYVTLHGKRVRAALDDDLARGDFRGAVNEPYSHVHLLLDLDGDGRFVSRGETFDVAKPFNIGGTTYQITGMSPLGETFTIVESAQKVPEAPILPNFRAGDIVPPFVKTTLDGRKLTFPGDYKHKLVLIDFWATWCGPCLAELPNVRAAYSKFHDQGFEILGVSLDNSGQSEMLAKFTKVHGMPWPQIYDGKAWEGDLPKLMVVGLSGVPDSFLVDGNTGLILATTVELRGAYLIPTVEEALRRKVRRDTK